MAHLVQKVASIGTREKPFAKATMLARSATIIIAIQLILACVFGQVVRLTSSNDVDVAGAGISLSGDGQLCKTLYLPQDGTTSLEINMTDSGNFQALFLGGSLSFDTLVIRSDKPVFLNEPRGLLAVKNLVLEYTGQGIGYLNINAGSKIRVGETVTLLNMQLMNRGALELEDGVTFTGHDMDSEGFAHYGSMITYGSATFDRLHAFRLHPGSTWKHVDFDLLESPSVTSITSSNIAGVSCKVHLAGTLNLTSTSQVVFRGCSVLSHTFNVVAERGLVFTALHV